MFTQLHILPIPTGYRTQAQYQTGHVIENRQLIRVKATPFIYNTFVKFAKWRVDWVGEQQFQLSMELPAKTHHLGTRQKELLKLVFEHDRQRRVAGLNPTYALVSPDWKPQIDSLIRRGLIRTVAGWQEIELTPQGRKHVYENL